MPDGTDTFESAEPAASLRDSPASYGWSDAPAIWPGAAADEIAWLESRLGRKHARQRLGIEASIESSRLHRGIRGAFSLGRLIETMVPVAVRASGLLSRGRANTARIAVLRNQVRVAGLQPAFEGCTLLQVSDLHADISGRAMLALPGVLAGLQYDACVITGDFRGLGHGPCGSAMAAVREALSGIPAPVFGVTGNHDSSFKIRGLEEMGIRMLMNESVCITRAGSRIWLAGVDDPHRYRTDNMRKALAGVPDGEVTVLLSHTPERHTHAADAGVSLMLCGHTHGGQICLPGRVPLLLRSKHPRRMAAGPWQTEGMAGYTSRGVGTSALEARFNCPPEVTLHTLVAAR